MLSEQHVFYARARAHTQTWTTEPSGLLHAVFNSLVFESCEQLRKSLGNGRACNACLMPTYLFNLNSILCFRDTRDMCDSARCCQFAFLFLSSPCFACFFSLVFGCAYLLTFIHTHALLHTYFLSFSHSYMHSPHQAHGYSCRSAHREDDELRR